MKSNPSNQKLRIWKKWEKRSIKIQKNKERIFFFLLDKYGKKGNAKFSTMIRNKLQQLYNSGLTRDELGKIVTFHRLISSTPPIRFCEKFDLDGNLSIEKFFKDSLEKLLENKEEKSWIESKIIS